MEPSKSSQSSSKNTASRLGKPIQLYPGRKAGRWIFLVLAVMFSLAGLGILILVLWQAGLQLRDFGPAMVGELLFWPGLLACAVLILAVMFGVAAFHREPRSLTIYQSGFILRERDRVHAWHWADVIAITSRITRNYLVGIYSGTRHSYILGRVDGSEMILDDSIQRVEQALRFIQQETFQGRFEQVVQKVKSGDSIAFGPFQLESVGFRIGERAYSWADLQGVEMRNGKLYINGQTGISLGVDVIPNLDVLVTILLQNVKP